ncbi:DNA-binding response regulator [Streptomyces pluripotens]|uniref:DNA-binding response regulator n=1 Tax=Streptomyces pluripotens TaxID=1355015 RepID=A0A221NZG7_9ACTN|nr:MULTISPECIES: response regulator transcription factor [Streptomyces]ARP71112.1 hypothetical protein LK06_015350 [Streptomyces pluripotens]ASN25360.1 DNA-binding response regulator [Streptomyces pluripotens]
MSRLCSEERRVLELIDKGLAHHQIGAWLQPTKKTIKNYGRYVSDLLTEPGMQRRSRAATYPARRRAEKHGSR